MISHRAFPLLLCYFGTPIVWAIFLLGCLAPPANESPEDRAVREAVQLARVETFVEFLAVEAAAFVADGTLKAEDVAAWTTIAKTALALGTALQANGNAATVQERIDAQAAVDRALAAALHVALARLHTQDE